MQFGTSRHVLVVLQPQWLILSAPLNHQRIKLTCYFDSMYQYFNISVFKCLHGILIDYAIYHDNRYYLIYCRALSVSRKFLKIPCQYFESVLGWSESLVLPNQYYPIRDWFLDCYFAHLCGPCYNASKLSVRIESQ